jgi:hypothetical protein
MLVQGALQQYLGDLIAVQAVEVEAIDSTFKVSVRYSLLSDGSVRVDNFSTPGGGA